VRLLREGKAAVSRDLAGILDHLGSSAEIWRARLTNLSGSRLLGRFFAASRERLKEMSERLNLSRLPNLAGCPTRSDRPRTDTPASSARRFSAYIFASWIRSCCHFSTDMLVRPIPFYGLSCIVGPALSNMLVAPAPGMITRRGDPRFAYPIFAEGIFALPVPSGQPHQSSSGHPIACPIRLHLIAHFADPGPAANLNAATQTVLIMICAYP